MTIGGFRIDALNAYLVGGWQVCGISLREIAIVVRFRGAKRHILRFRGANRHIAEGGKHNRDGG